MNLEQHIEGVLFYKAEPMKKAALAALFSVDPEEIDLALEALSKRLSGGGTRLTQTDETVQLVTAPDVSETIALLRKEELKRDIGKAGAETLAIILYRGPISRADIDRIRGVNSSFILRNLLIRGLIERRDHPKDHRSYVYAVTPDLLNHLGLTKREALPEFERIMSSIDTFEAGQDRVEKEERLLS
jgi:segregation and condensation protein B